MSERQLVRVDQQGPVLHVQLDYADMGNAFSLSMLDQLTRVFTTMQDDTTVRAMVLSGAGDDFSLGGQRAEFEGLHADPQGGQMRVLGNKAMRMCDALARSNVVKIARMQGKAVGAGVVVSLLCNLRVASDEATFRLPEAGLQVPPAWGGILGRLIQTIGHSAASELLLTSRVVRAEEALALGLVHKVVPEDQLDSQVDRWLRPMMRRQDNGSLRTMIDMLNAYAGSASLVNGAVLDPGLLASAVALDPRNQPGHGMSLTSTGAETRL
ncbi:enoyl-CoA hydratase/isomerase family protein [Streptomyces sp. 8L]|uniref:enoyl-CoA hydratase/isomerase family protein n=1 Tax=unclassified Streptomyces TaxID=2593676 RepID=UPI001CD3FE73|nr:enoyl-CoA hydratase/isomerase family protein [Streptomyces sp. 8L]MCA1217150.1 enoyl-CoA hydratase/isomerase family protein [Streptomyces sp. 8L]